VERLRESSNIDEHRIPERHVVLVSPEIHWNTGNIGRTCLGIGANLHLIEPIGFSLESREVKRAGLDYWADVPVSVWKTYDAFCENVAPRPNEVALFSKRGPRSFRELPPQPRMFLIFGSETRGLPASILSAYPDAVFHIPIRRDIRSLNLSTAAGIALYESLRSYPAAHQWAPVRRLSET